MQLASFIFFAALVSYAGTSVSNESNEWVSSIVEIVDLEYEDHCDKVAEATWNELLGIKNSLQNKIELDKAFGVLSQLKASEVRETLVKYPLQPGDEHLKRKVKLMLEPGNTMLDTEQWIKLVTFGDKALNKLRFATNYECGTNTNCTLRELYNSMATEQYEETLRRMKISWEDKLPDLKQYREQILPLLVNASKKNNYDSVQDFWEFLVEYEGGLLKAREIWEHVKPLYVKLQKYVTLRLQGAEAVGKPLPVHVLRSLTGSDWSNIIESVLPQHADIYQKLHAQLQLKNLGGKEAFKTAARLVEKMGFQPIEKNIWTESKFNGTCPTVIVDSCKPNKIKVFTCKDVSIGHYMDAHEDIMKIKYKEMTATYRNNTYILREANRYSALFDAISGFASLLSITPHALDRAGLYPISRFNYQNNANHHRLVLQLILALRDLPKLNYYLAADEWRLQVLKGTITPSKTIKSWSEFRKEFSLLEGSDVDILGEPSVLFNEPLLGSFMGLILKYQIYHSFAEELMSDDDDLVQHVSENHKRVHDVMIKGFVNPWPQMISSILEREQNLDATGLTDYFKLLDDYIDSQLDPTANSENAIDYEEPPPEEPPSVNEIPQTVIETESPSTHDSILENVIEDDNVNMKHNVESSTVGVLEVVAKGDQKEDFKTPKEASYSTYWWIGVLVALAIVIVFIAIIANKRHNHRKELEKQRRENSHA